MDHLFQDKNRYRNLVAGISVLHGCRLVSIDFSGRTIKLNGPLNAIKSCCTELKGVFDPECSMDFQNEKG